MGRELVAPQPEQWLIKSPVELLVGLVRQSGGRLEQPIGAALAAATARFEQDLSEGAYAEQQRLLKRKLEFDSRLRQMASARSAAPGGAA